MSNLRDERYILFTLAAINFIHIIDFMIMMPLGSFLMPYFKISPQSFTVLVSSYAIAAGCTSFFSAFWVNNFDRKKVLIFGFMGFLIGTLLCALAPSYLILLLARIVAGLFGGLLSAQVISIIADIIPFERRGAAMGITMGAFSMASIIGVPSALFLSNHYGWHSPFVMVVILGLILIPIVFKVIPSLTSHISTEDGVSKLEVMRSISRDSRQQRALAFTGLMMMGHFMIIPFINPYLEFNVGFSKSFTPFVYLCGGLASLISAQLAGKLADKYGKWRVYSFCVLASLPMVWFITHLTMMPMVIVLSAFALWFSFATGRGLSSQALVSNVTDPTTRGSFQSFVSFVNQIGTGLASVFAGFIVTADSASKLSGYATLGYASILVLLSTLWFGKKIFSEQ
jgi:MFS transporter, DHA1 family, inner membrane transport protein